MKRIRMPMALLAAATIGAGMAATGMPVASADNDVSVTTAATYDVGAKVLDRLGRPAKDADVTMYGLDRDSRMTRRSARDGPAPARRAVRGSRRHPHLARKLCRGVRTGAAVADRGQGHPADVRRHVCPSDGRADSVSHRRGSSRPTSAGRSAGRPTTVGDHPGQPCPPPPPIGPPAPANLFAGEVEGVWARPDADGDLGPTRTRTCSRGSRTAGSSTVWPRRRGRRAWRGCSPPSKCSTSFPTCTRHIWRRAPHGMGGGGGLQHVTRQGRTLTEYYSTDAGWETLSGDVWNDWVR